MIIFETNKGMKNSNLVSVKNAFLTLAIITCVVLILYQPILSTGLWSSDYIFLERAGRSSLSDYLRLSFDLRYENSLVPHRSLFGIIMWVQYYLFHENGIGYHVVNIAFHWINCLLLARLVYKLSGKASWGLVSALLLASFSLNSLTIYWVSDISELAAGTMYLSALSLWYEYLKKRESRFYLATLLAFTLALGFKETAISLPITLFAMDLVFFKAKFYPLRVIQRYAPFAIPLLAILLSQFPDQVQATVSTGTVWSYLPENLIQYLVLLVFPWMPESFSGEGVARISSLIVIASLVYLIISRRDTQLLFFAAATLIALSPFLTLYFFAARLLYLPTIFCAAVWSIILLKRSSPLSSRQGVQAISPILFSGILFISGILIATDSNDLAGLGRIDRLPFRAISQQHPTFSRSTILYLVDPPTLTSFLSGMLFLRYGTNVTVGGTEPGVTLLRENQDGIAKLVNGEQTQIARLRNYRQALVYFFGEQNQLTEVVADPLAEFSTNLALPVDFEDGIRLEGLEVSNSTLKPDQPLALIVYWRASGRINKDYTVFVHLVDEQGMLLVGDDSIPSGRDRRTSEWRIGQFIADAHLLTIPSDAVTKKEYRILLGLYDLTTMKRLGVKDSLGNARADDLVIYPIQVID